MGEEKRIFKGVLFAPGNPELKAIKLRAHNLSQEYSQTYEREVEKRAAILAQLVGQFGQGSFIQGPVFFHYGSRTSIGDCFFGNYNLTIQDDARVTIGNHVNFGPNVTLVTPIHPLLPRERRGMIDQSGNLAPPCYAKPITIGNDVWFGANVTVCGGVTIGDNCVIGAGSVVVKDIPPNTLAAGVPCKAIRPLSPNDSMVNFPELLDGYTLLPE